MPKRIRCMVLTVASVFAGLGASSGALLTPAHEVTLEGWLGQGDQAFSLLYQKSAGDSSASFHAAVDHKGATFTLLEAIVDGSTYLVGGYNPQSWTTSGGYNTTTPDSARTAFIYNLTTLRLQRQRLTADPWSPFYGSYQAYNVAFQGPTFGGGFDLFIRMDLGQGYANQYSYGAGGPGCGGTQAMNIVGFVTCGTSPTGFAVGALEVYTFRAIPEPSTVALLLVGAGLAGSTRRWRLRAHEGDSAKT